MLFVAHGVIFASAAPFRVRLINVVMWELVCGTDAPPRPRRAYKDPVIDEVRKEIRQLIRRSL